MPKVIFSGECTINAQSHLFGRINNEKLRLIAFVRQSICFVGLFIVAFATILAFGKISFCCNQFCSADGSGLRRIYPCRL